MNRRLFLETTTRASLAYSALPLLGSLSRTARYRTALIGSGWWGTNILRVAMKAGQSELVALADPDARQLRACQTEMGRFSSDRPRLYRDYRELLQKEKPEIVIVATPDHWHALCCIAAVEAGAHVYVEKPISHTIGEGRAMVNAARRHNRVVQVGTHRRVSPHNVSANAFLKSGKAGKIGMVRAFVHYGGGPGQPTADAPTPPELDWDLWCGPAPLRPFNPAIHPKGFRLFLDYANGQLGDWGIHWLDQVLWWTEEKFPKQVYSTGGRAIRRDHTDAPDHQIATWKFDDFTLEWEHRLFASNEAEKHNVGCYFYGTEGTFHLGWLDGWTFYPANKNKPVLHEDPRLDEPDQQNIAGLWDNMLTCIGNGQRPVCDIETVQRSTNLALLGMLSYKLGRSVNWDGEKELFPGDEAANALLQRNYRAGYAYPKWRS